MGACVVRRAVDKAREQTRGAYPGGASPLPTSLATRGPSLRRHVARSTCRQPALKVSLSEGQVKLHRVERCSHLNWKAGSDDDVSVHTTGVHTTVSRQCNSSTTIHTCSTHWSANRARQMPEIDLVQVYS